MAQGQGKAAKAAQAIQKAQALYEIGVSTYRAAMGAYAALAPIPIVGPALGVAAAAAAAYSLGEVPTPPRLNYNNYGEASGEVWGVPSPLTGVAPSRSQLFAALNAGVTPIGVRASGSTFVVKRVTTRYKNGAIVDYRIRDGHKVTVCDRYGDDLIAKAASQFRGKQIGDDPINDSPLQPNVVTPKPVKASVDALTQRYSDNGLLQNAAQIQAETVVQRDGSNRTRMTARIPLQPIDLLDQMAFRVDQIA